MRNLPSTVSVSEIAKEFKNFGRLKPDGVVIRNRKVHSILFPSNFMLEFCLNSTALIPMTCDQDNIGVCYAFVEFEDISGVHNAIKVCIEI